MNKLLNSTILFSIMLTELPNIGKTLASKLKEAGIETKEELVHTGCENTVIKLHTINSKYTCINSTYAIEGAIQGIRWHGLDKERKLELKEFYHALIKDHSSGLK